MYNFDPLWELIEYLAYGSIILWPLGLWKFVEIVIWLIQKLL